MINYQYQFVQVTVPHTVLSVSHIFTTAAEYSKVDLSVVSVINKIMTLKIYYHYEPQFML